VSLAKRVIVLAGVAYALAGCGGDEPKPAGGANLWVDANGGSCTRQAAAAPYDDRAACESFDAAWDAAQAGDRIRVRAGTYAEPQNITGDKASETAISGEGRVTITAPVTAASNLTLENVTIDGGDKGQFDAFGIGTARDVTLKRVKIHGYYARVVLSGANGFRWLGGEHGTPGWTPRKRQCTRPPAPDGDGNPVEIDGGRNIIIDGVHFARQDHGDFGRDGCSAGDNFHLEIIRLQDAVDGFTLRNSYFESKNRANTAVILNTPMGGISNNVVIVNNFFGGTEGAGPFQVGAPGPGSDCKDQLIAYNTFEQGPGAWQCTSYDNVRFVGNVGWRQAFGDCAGEFADNVWQDTNALQCQGTDTWVQGPRFGLDDLNLERRRSLAPAPGSPAIDAAEKPGGGAVCTEPEGTTGGTGGIGGRDRLGRKRPVGDACDAGSLEFQG
jgi:hypothetical protein